MAQEPASAVGDGHGPPLEAAGGESEARRSALIRSIVASPNSKDIGRLLEAQGAGALSVMWDSSPAGHNLVFALAKGVPGEGESLARYQENVAEAVRLLIATYGLSLEADKNAQTPVFFASRHGNSDVLQVLLRAKSDPQHMDKNEQTALFYAARFNQADCAQKLLATGADPNHRDKLAGQTPLTYSAKFGSVECLQVLIEGNADPHITDKNEQTPLHYAARHDMPGCARRLLAAGADACVPDRHGETPTFYAAAGMKQNNRTLLGSPACLEVLLQHAGQDAARTIDLNGRSPLFCAYNIECFQALLRHNCCPDVMDHSGRSVLFYVVGMGSLEKVRLLLQHRAVTNLRDGNGQTPLHCACKCKRPPPAPLRICEELLKASPGLVSAIDKNGRTAIFESRDVACIEVLLKHRCDANALDQDGRTAIFVAAQEGDESRLRLLLRYGAQVDVTDRNGDNSIAFAQQAGHSLAAQILLEQLAVRRRHDGGPSSQPAGLARFEQAKAKGRGKAKGRAKAKTNSQAQAKVLPPRTTRGVPPRRMDPHTMGAAPHSMGAAKRGFSESPEPPHWTHQGQQGRLSGARIAGGGPGSTSERASKPRRFSLVHDDAALGSRELEALLDKLLEQLPWLAAPVR